MMKNTINSILLILATVTTSSASSIILGGPGSLSLSSGSETSYTESFAGFDIDDQDITYSGTLELVSSSSGSGSVRIGLIVQDAFFLIFPKFGDSTVGSSATNRQGAVSVYNSITSNSRIVNLSPGNGTQGDLGYDPALLDTFDLTVLLQRNGSSDVDVTFSITESGNSIDPKSQTFDTFTVAETSLGASAGGVFDTFGVGIQADNGITDINYSHVQASNVAAVPEPSTSSLAALGGLYLLWRRNNPQKH